MIADFFCESDWAEYYGNCYRFHNENITLSDGKMPRDCAWKTGAVLTSIRDYGEMNFLHLMLTSDWYTENRTTYIGALKLIRKNTLD